MAVSPPSKWRYWLLQKQRVRHPSWMHRYSTLLIWLCTPIFLSIEMAHCRLVHTAYGIPARDTPRCSSLTLCTRLSLSVTKLTQSRSSCKYIPLALQNVQSRCCSNRRASCMCYVDHWKGSELYFPNTNNSSRIPTFRDLLVHGAMICTMPFPVS